MCLGVPGRVTELRDDRGVPMATVDFGGVTKDVCLSFAPEALVDQYVIVHAGFAIAVLDEDEAAASLDLFAELGLVAGGDETGMVAGGDETGMAAGGDEMGMAAGQNGES